VIWTLTFNRLIFFHEILLDFTKQLVESTPGRAKILSKSAKSESEGKMNADECGYEFRVVYVLFVNNKYQHAGTLLNKGIRRGADLPSSL
jgi:hypothetical protein